MQRELGVERVVKLASNENPLGPSPRALEAIAADMAGFWRGLVADSQLRWLGPEKGVVHLATAALVDERNHVHRRGDLDAIVHSG